MSTLYYESSISHHGVKGQKWGVRRYQNPDGTLTAKGRVHRVKQQNRENLKTVKTANSLERGSKIDSSKFGIAGAVGKHAGQSAAVTTAAVATTSGLKQVRKDLWNSYLDYVFEPGSRGTVRRTDLDFSYGKPAWKKMVGLLDGMDAIDAATDVIGVGTAVFNAYKGVKIAKDIHDYRNYKKSKNSK